jgi:hypothetical protein
MCSKSSFYYYKTIIFGDVGRVRGNHNSQQIKKMMNKSIYLGPQNENVKDQK